MKYELINEPLDTVKKTLFVNRGVKVHDIENYLNLTDKCLNHYSLLFNDSIGTNFYVAYYTLMWGKKYSKKIYIIVDCDTDGFTSSSIFINYMSLWFGSEWVKEYVTYILHDDKSHGIKLNKLPKNNDFILVVPDAGTNDFEQCKKLYERNIPVLILDHHLPEKDKYGNIKYNDYANIINNQTSDYPNKQISGACVVYKFLEFVDSMRNVPTKDSDLFLDLVALGMISDMMSLSECETKHLINKGVSSIRNPFIIERISSNDMKTKITNGVNPLVFAFYIAPLINAMCRSGNMEEKTLLFKSLLNDESHNVIKSEKRGHKGEKTSLVSEGLRVALNVKKKQDNAKKAAISFIKENRIDLSHSVVIVNNNGEIDKNLAGLVCNDLLHEIQRPILCPSLVENRYEGSVRGYPQCGVKNFNDFCLKSGLVNWCRGHENAFGISIPKDNIEQFIEYCDKNIDLSDITYYVDYIWDSHSDMSAVKEICELSDIWGQDMNEPLVCLKNIGVPNYKVQIYTKEKDNGEKVNTLKINLDTNTTPFQNEVTLMKFNATSEEIAMFSKDLFNSNSLKYDFVGKCNKNVYKGKVTYQLIVEDMCEHKEEEQEKKYIFKW